MKRSLPIFARYWLPVLLYAGIIVYLSSLSSPDLELPELFPGIDDKIIHAIEYAILAILSYRAILYASVEKLAIHAPFWAIMAAVLFGISDEIHQAFVPLRHTDAWDVLADAVGASIGVCVWRWVFDDRRLEST